MGKITEALKKVAIAKMNGKEIIKMEFQQDYNN